MCRLIPFIAILFMATAVSAAELASTADIAAKTSLIVLPFESRGASAENGAMADDYLMEAFTQLQRFIIVEREQLDRVLLEQKLSREKLTNPQQSIALGKLLSADQILSGRIEELKGETVITLKMVATATSLTRTYSASAKTNGMRDFRRLISEIAVKVAGDFPLLDGKISKAVGETYKADFAKSGLRTGLEVIVYRWGEAVKHPVTGRQLGRRVIRVASGRISTVENRTASIVLSKLEKDRKVKEGDLLITK